MPAWRVAAIGLASWDEILVTARFPEPGSFAVVERVIEQPGGTTANIVSALGRLGVDTALAAMVGDDDEGRRLRDDLASSGCDVRHVRVREGEPTDRGLIIVSGAGSRAERTILWRQGARLRRGDFLPIEEFFAADLVVVDVDDPALRRLLVDLPMHVSPRTRLLGPLQHLAGLAPEVGLDLALRHDYLTGNERELRYLTGAPDLEGAIARLQDEMVLSQTRFAAISRGPGGCTIVARDTVEHVPAFPIDAVDPTGAGDAFAAGVALGILERWPLAQTGRFANAMGALATRVLGARGGLPGRDEVDALLARAGEAPG